MEVHVKKKLCQSFFLLFALWGTAFASDRCVMSFSACPQTFNNDTIVVPSSVIALAPSILGCLDSTYVVSAPPVNSFFFIIDNSSSMRTSDATGARYNVTRALIDTIYAKNPNSQVGVAVFESSLYFDPTTTATFPYSQYFTRMATTYDNLPNQAYLTLLTLNQFYNGVEGKTIIDSALATSGTGNNVALKYTPNFTTTSNTNINIAFLAARQAFAASTAAKANQYIVFLSDGEANRGTNDPGPDSIWYFRDSTRNVPTTFTVFFNSGGSTAIPASIQTMTDNIKVNGYSSSNPSSADYAITATYTTLMNILLTNVASRISLPTTPVKMVMNGKTSSAYSNGSFIFPDTLFLGNGLTQFSMNITYQYTDPRTSTVKDTVKTINFAVQKSGTVATPSGISLHCSTIPDAAISVTATVLDTNGEGHIDKIDLTWTDTAQIRTTMPGLTKWILSLTLVTADGSKISLNASQIVPDIKNKIIHIIINENPGTAYETNVNVTSSSFVLSDSAMSLSGRAFTVSNIVDNAGPVIKNVCFSPSIADTIRVTFTETVLAQTDPKSLFVLLSNGQTSTISPTSVVRLGDKILYVYPANTLTDNFSVKEGIRQPFTLGLCGDVSLVTEYHVASNPFIPGVTSIPSKQQDSKNPITAGTRIEVSLIKGIQQQLESGLITGKVIIFDAVGNTVLVQKSMSTDISTGTKLFWNWDGKTTKGVTAGAGTYVARITVENSSTGQKQTIRQIIGIKQK